MQTNFKDVIDLINQSPKIILTTHVVPDGDAIGSVIAMAAYLKHKGKIPFIINHSETPFNLKFLDKDNIIRVFSENESINSKLIETADLIFILDTNDFSRTRSMESALTNSVAKKICIDHHTGLNPELYDAYISNTEYPSNCSIIYDFIKSDNEKYLTKEIASALYVGIMTDTGSFRHPRTDAAVFTMCADLVSKGADPVSLYENIYATTTIENLKLSAKFIESLEFHFDNKVVIGTVTQEDFRSLGLNIDHVEGFSSIIMNILGIKIGVVLVELKDNIKISFRSKGNIPVNELAKEFGGGGHKNAAGANVKDTNIEELKNKIIERLGNFLD
ncbi:MAG TPA: bifunctional oligoribonuclease/PAP phosphatase NrnA [Ignavibacteria bacterium]|nr:bifunctional oligoribonuclease/PAP phosphatase NrnA [Ignavibacteria bacterium]